MRQMTRNEWALLDEPVDVEGAQRLFAAVVRQALADAESDPAARRWLVEIGIPEVEAITGREGKRLVLEALARLPEPSPRRAA